MAKQRIIAKQLYYYAGLPKGMRLSAVDVDESYQWNPEKGTFRSDHEHPELADYLKKVRDANDIPFAEPAEPEDKPKARKTSGKPERRK